MVCPAIPVTMDMHAAREMFGRHGASTLPVIDAMDRVVGRGVHHAPGDLPPAGPERLWGPLCRARRRAWRKRLRP
ncbi:hypothetical protein SAMN05421548_12888 [Paraburkholderia lycopersici]|uniref:CBS domain-containing protein n=1 Tax=Paraburkholderia lycopersici TaxID=416944 RepID=A0A1G6YT60_9BURK|nr:hypothetical protein SAMN05421548_12888 [Paraburkholderia lycopersici]